MIEFRFFWEEFNPLEEEKIEGVSRREIKKAIKTVEKIMLEGITDKERETLRKAVEIMEN